MGRSITPSFVLTRPLVHEIYADKNLEKKFNAANRLYNAGVRHCIHNLESIRNNEEYKQTLHKYREETDSKCRKELSGQLASFRTAYGLTEYEIQKYLSKGYQRAYKGSLGSHIVQKIATSLSVSVDKAIFTGSKIHFRKYGQTNSFEDKSAVSGIIYKPEEDAVYMNGVCYKLEPIRGTDLYAQEAMTHRIKYCGIIRKPFASGYRYFVQFVMEGDPPVKDEHLYPKQAHKHMLGKGTIGLDTGSSTCAFYGQDAAGFQELAEDGKKYNAKIQRCTQIYERRMRINNPDCYNDDGTRIKGKKNYCHTNGMAKAQMRLKNAYRKKSEFVKQQHNILANEIVSHCDTVVKEPMNFNQLARKSKKTAERQEKGSIIIDSKGNIKEINKFKKKKRFGKSVNDRSPGLFNKTIKEKIECLGGKCIEVDIKKYKASQYDHLTREASKPKLSERTKYVGDALVQRDLYSAFLLSEIKDLETIDFDKCERDFDRFLKQQEQIVNKMIDEGKNPRNFGLKDFLKAKEIV